MEGVLREVLSECRYQGRGGRGEEGKETEKEKIEVATGTE